MNNKINAKHLERAAYVYIQQSSLQQVRQNSESGRRQYELQDLARELGFAEVVIIDEDLGISGAGHHERPGFGRLLAAVCDGRVGAVLAMEASRLARNNRDWHHLIDLCVLTETLVLDAEGIYDPRLLNDRLLLGLKGTTSEFELGLLRQRAQEAYRQKVLRGEVLTIVPIGFVRSHSNRIEMTPDREVQEAVRRVFSDFERFGTLRQVLLWYHQENITIPVARAGQDGSRTVWRLPNYGLPCSLFPFRLNLEVEGDRVADLHWRGSKETKLNVTGTKVGGYVVKLRLYSQVAEMRIWTEGRRFENHDKLRNLSPKLLHSPREIPNRR